MDEHIGYYFQEQAMEEAAVFTRQQVRVGSSNETERSSLTTCSSGDAFICNTRFPENRSLLSSTHDPLQESFLNIQP